MLTLLIVLLVVGIIVAIASMFFAGSSDKMGGAMFFIITMYMGILSANAGFWGLVLYFGLQILKDVLQ